MHLRDMKGLSLAIPFLMAALSGCISVQPFANYARPGDTITLSVGPQDGMTKGNTRVWFTPDSNPGGPIEVTSGVKAIFNLYADKGSFAYSPNNGNADLNFRYLHHEPWLTVIALDLPQGLPVGPGAMQVQTTAAQPRALESGNFGPYPNINTVSARIEILPGTGAPHPLQYRTTYGGTLNGNLTDVATAHQALIKPPVEDPQNQWTATYGAVEMKLTLPLADKNTGLLTEDNLRLVTQDVATYTRSKLQVSWSLNGNQLTVLFLSSAGKIKYYEPRFSVVAESAIYSATPTITSVRYFDMNGNAMSGPAISNYVVAVKGAIY